MATYKTCSTVEDFRAAYAEYGQKVGRSSYAKPDHDAYLDSLAIRMAAACAKMGEAVEVRVG